MKKKILNGFIAAAVLTVAVFGMAGCGSKDNSAGGADGKAEKDSVMIAGSTSVQPLSEAIAEAFMDSNKDITVEVQAGGSGQGIKSISEKIADIGSLSREVKGEEKSSVAKEYVIARDGVVVVVNEDVKVDDLTLKQIKDIYTGKIANWKEVGGDDKPISVVSREEGSGTRGAFTEITGVLEKDDAGKEIDKTTAKALVQPSTGAVKKTVSTTPDSIGYVSLAAVDDGIKTVKVEKVTPTVEHVRNGTYKISRPFVYVVGDKISKNAQSFIDYAMGSEGQALVKDHGFIPVK